MSAALELIEIVEAAGGRFMVDGGRLGIVPATAAAPVIDELREHKAELLAELARRPAMPAGVRLLSYAPATPPVKLSRWETATDIDKFVRSTLTQVDARLHGNDWLAGNWTLSALIDRLAAVGCHVALENKERMLQ